MLHSMPTPATPVPLCEFALSHANARVLTDNVFLRGMAPVAHVLFNKFMKFNPKNPKWLNRDRFVLS